MPCRHIYVKQEMLDRHILSKGGWINAQPGVVLGTAEAGLIQAVLVRERLSLPAQGPVLARVAIGQTPLWFFGEAAGSFLAPAVPWMRELALDGSAVVRVASFRCLQPPAP